MGRMTWQPEFVRYFLDEQSDSHQQVENFPSIGNVQRDVIPIQKRDIQR